MTTGGGRTERDEEEARIGGDVPQWLLDVAEYEATMFELKRMRDALSKRSPLDVAIDQATGYAADLGVRAQELMDHATQIRRRLDQP